MRRPLCMICLLCVLFILGIIELFPYQYEFASVSYTEEVLIEGKVRKKESKTKDGKITYSIYLEPVSSKQGSIRNSDMSQTAPKAGEISGKDSNVHQLNNIEQLYEAEGILCYMNEGSYVPNIGSVVWVKGTIVPFEKPNNPGEFNAPIHYKIKGIDLKMYGCKLVAYGQSYSFLKENLFRIRQYFCVLLDECFQKEYSGIAKAILFAVNGEMLEETKELYQRNGMLHILCVSGLHISILGMGLYKILEKLKLPDKWNALICLLFLLMYGVMIGMGTSVFRAIMMFGLRLVAKLLGRTYDMLTAACVAAIFVLIEQPLYLYHSGFLLSFLSVVALSAFRPLFPDKFCKVEFLNKRCNALFSGLVIWLVTLPVYGRFYYEVSLSGLILNVLILPFATVVLVLVIGVCALGSLYLPLGILLARVCEVFLYMFEKAFEAFDSLGRNSLILGYKPLWLCALFYIGLTGMVFLVGKIKRRYVFLGVVLLCVVFLWKAPEDFVVSFLAVGQGDCAVVEYQDMVCIVDAGSSSEKEMGKYTLLPYLKYRGISKVDYVFLSHGDMDHINGVEALLLQHRTGIKIGGIVISDLDNVADYGNIFYLATEYGIPVYEMQVGDKMVAGELCVECLSPDERLLTQGDTNEASMVLLWRLGDMSVLFTGDTEGEGEKLVQKELAKRGIDEITVLKVAHHGSKNSTGEEFLKAVNPEIAVISYGENNRYGHPHKETVERLWESGSINYHTAKSGAITISCKKKIEISAYKKES